MLLRILDFLHYKILGSLHQMLISPINENKRSNLQKAFVDVKRQFTQQNAALQIVVLIF